MGFRAWGLGLRAYRAIGLQGLGFNYRVQRTEV